MSGHFVLKFENKFHKSECKRLEVRPINQAHSFMDSSTDSRKLSITGKINWLLNTILSKKNKLYGSETHLREVPIYVKSGIVPS